MHINKWQRKSLQVLGVLAFILLLIFYFSISTIDTTPYFETTYYKNTIQKMDSAIQDIKVSKGELFTGFASVNITPTIVQNHADSQKGEFNAIKMAGYGNGQIAKRIHDSIFAKAIAIDVAGQQVVFISADLVIIPELVVSKVAENLKGTIRRDQLFFGATHTHSSIGNCIPGFVGESFEGEFQPAVVEWLGQKITQLIINVLKDKKPSKFSSGHIKVPNLIRNRIIGNTGRLNDKLDLISFVQNNGRKAVIGIYGAHATTIGTWNDAFSADYPGYFQKRLEADTIDLALFFAGTVGSHSNKGDGEKYKKAQYIGETLADSAKTVIQTMSYDSVISISRITSELETPKLQAVYISDRLRLSPFIGQKLMYDMGPIYLQGLKLNNFIWIAMPYELSGEYGIDLKNALELEGYTSALTSFNGQYLGYIVPQKYYYFNTYEARLMGWYGPSMGDYLMELNYKMSNALTDKRL